MTITPTLQNKKQQQNNYFYCFSLYVLRRGQRFPKIELNSSITKNGLENIYERKDRLNGLASLGL